MQQQWADDIYLQMEHKQIKNVTNNTCVETVINAVKKVIVRLKKFIA